MSWSTIKVLFLLISFKTFFYWFYFLRFGDPLKLEDLSFWAATMPNSFWVSIMFWIFSWGDKLNIIRAL